MWIVIFLFIIILEDLWSLNQIVSISEILSGFCFGQKCHVKKKDIRKFLDGIYVSEKGTILGEE